MTYNVFGGTLSFTQSSNQSSVLLEMFMQFVYCSCKSKDMMT